MFTNTCKNHKLLFITEIISCNKKKKKNLIRNIQQVLFYDKENEVSCK